MRLRLADVSDPFDMPIEQLISSATIEANLPVGAGLGSSASLSCAIAKCFPNADHFELAKRIDDYFHQGSSGIDVFTILNGGLCSFNVAEGFRKLADPYFDTLSHFHFSIIDTGARRRVSVLKAKLLPEHVQSYVEGIKPIATKFFNHLSDGSLSLPLLCELFNDANNHLVRLGVSTPLLDDLFQRLKDSGLQLGAKITGGGGGGCILVVHSPSVTRQDLESFVPQSGGVLYYAIKLKRS